MCTVLAAAPGRVAGSPAGRKGTAYQLPPMVWRMKLNSDSIFSRKLCTVLVPSLKQARNLVVKVP